ncbi:MAG TPA: alpha/beta hydrolase [Gemmatimonadaceae bacterium]|nr:alpha/beta hydrolase [Gemmatimonadaceae bacterium]
MRALRVSTAAALVTVALMVAACDDKAPRPAPQPGATTEVWNDPSPHQSRSVRVNGVSLNVLDWGGTGDGLVLIHGLADSPHSFDDLAPGLTSGHHVIAYARRGHGQSDHPPAGPYDNETLVEDLRQLLDSLRIDRAVLGGWSMGGNEITRFAERYPERVAGLIYFDAGYEWSDTVVARLFGNLPILLAPARADFASLPAYRGWWVRSFWGSGTPTASAEAEIRDVSRADSAGTIFQPTDAVIDQLFKSLTEYRRDYSKVKAPVLALYADRFFTNQVPDSVRAGVDAWNGEFKAFQAASIARLRRELRTSPDIHVLPETSHNNFPMASRDTMVALINAFLAKPPSASSR